MKKQTKKQLADFLESAISTLNTITGGKKGYPGGLHPPGQSPSDHNPGHFPPGQKDK